MSREETKNPGQNGIAPGMGADADLLKESSGDKNISPAASAALEQGQTAGSETAGKSADQAVHASKAKQEENGAAAGNESAEKSDGIAAGNSDQTAAGKTEPDKTGTAAEENPDQKKSWTAAEEKPEQKNSWAAADEKPAAGKARTAAGEAGENGTTAGRQDASIGGRAPVGKSHSAAGAPKADQKARTGQEERTAQSDHKDQKEVHQDGGKKAGDQRKGPKAEQPKEPKKRRPKKRAARTRRGLMPLLHVGTTTADCMFFVILALLPSAGVGIYHYGVRAMFIIGLAVASAVVTELLCDLIFRKGLTILDYSAVVTGLTVGLIMPPAVPYRCPVIASAVAIAAGKMLFGGIGKNFLNPAAVGKLVLLIAFPTAMDDFSTVTGTYGPNTPLRELLNGNEVTLLDMLTGNVSGCIGTTSVIALLLGALFLMITGVIDAQISLGCLVSFTIFYVLFGSHGLSLYFVGAQLCGGSLLFTAFFMANDYTTSPVGKRARIVDGLILGVLIGVFRCFFGLEENASLYALLITNVLTRLLEARLMPRPFGTRQVHRTVRVHAPMPAMENADQARPMTPEEAANAQMEADFAEFEESILPKNAANGSETAGTINSESVSMYENRQRLGGNVPPMPQAPVYDTWQPSWDQYPDQNGYGYGGYGAGSYGAGGSAGGYGMNGAADGYGRNVNGAGGSYDQGYGAGTAGGYGSRGSGGYGPDGGTGYTGGTGNGYGANGTGGYAAADGQTNGYSAGTAAGGLGMNGSASGYGANANGTGGSYGQGNGYGAGAATDGYGTNGAAGGYGTNANGAGGSYGQGYGAGYGYGANGPADGQGNGYGGGYGYGVNGPAGGYGNDYDTGGRTYYPQGYGNPYYQRYNHSMYSDASAAKPSMPQAGTGKDRKAKEQPENPGDKQDS